MGVYLPVNNNKRRFEGRPGGLPRGVRSHHITVAVYLFLATISLAVFGQTIRYDFVNFDDDLYVYNASAIQGGLTLKGIALAFTSPHARNWHPLTTISHMLDCQLYGLKAGGHHATNVVLLLLDYWPLRRFEQPSSTTGKGKISKSGNQRRVIRGLFLEKVPLVVLSAGSCLVTFVLQKRATGAIPPLPLPWRVENAFATYMIYAWKTLWPTRLAVFYPHPNDTLAIWEVILAI